MRVSGDAWSCEQAARTLRRAAAEVTRTRSTAVVSWRGAAAEQHLVFADAEAWRRQAVARCLADVADLLDGHARSLRELQARAAALIARAQDAGLILYRDGSVSPVPAVMGPPTPLMLAGAALQADARRSIQAGIAELEQDVQRAQSMLAEGMRQVGQSSQSPGVSWVPTWTDVPPIVPGVVAQIGRHPARWGPVLRSTPATAGFGIIWSVSVDVDQGRSVGESVLKAATATAVGLGAVALGAAAVAGAPVVAVGAVGLAAGTAAGWTAAKIWDTASPLPARQPRPPVPPLRRSVSDRDHQRVRQRPRPHR